MKSMIGLLAAIGMIALAGCEQSHSVVGDGSHDAVQDKQIRKAYKTILEQRAEIKELDRYLHSPRLNPSPTIEILVGKHVFRAEGGEEGGISPADLNDAILNEAERIQVSARKYAYKEEFPLSSLPVPLKAEVDVTVVPSRDEILIAALERMQENSNRQHEALLQETRNMQGQNMAFQERLLDRLLPPGPIIPSHPVRPPDCSAPVRK